MKRQRGRNRRPGGGGHHQNNNNPNRTMESNGPDTKVRGPAAVIYERYLQLARDAASSGDRVLSENYLQHADHYFRLVRSMQPAQPTQQTQERFGESEGYEEGAPDMERAEGAEAAADGEEQPDAEFPQVQSQGYEREGGGRRRGRRNRFRPGGEGDGAETREGGEERTQRRFNERSEGEDERGERPERQERRFRDRDGDERRRSRDEDPREGFSDGPKPAFLRSSE